jgi:hydrogenase expression/formation protein
MTDLEGFARRRILEGCDGDEIIKGLTELVGEFKEWEGKKKQDFSIAIYDEAKTSLGYKRLKDSFLKGLLDYPKSDVAMGEFGVGSRGEGDFKVHRDIAEIIGKSDVLIGPQEQDDAGVVEGMGRYVTVAVDGIHSRLSEFPFLAGFHAARATLRDVYVMGSRPVAMISDLHLADDGDIGKLYDYTAGVSTVADSTETPVVSGSTLRVGGDMVFGDRLVAAVGAVGVSDAKPLARRYAEAGDVILLTLGRGGGTIATTAIYSGNFEVVKETLNTDFMRCMEAIVQTNLQDNVHAMTDVTNGGLRGDAVEISMTSKTRLLFFENEVKRSVSKPVLNMLGGLEIDYLGVSTDSLMLILPKENAPEVTEALEQVSPVYEVGYVEKGEGAKMITEDGGEKELRPLFREAAYTKVKKVVGETTPEDFDKMSKSLDKAKKDAIKKKEEVKEWIDKG